MKRINFKFNQKNPKPDICEGLLPGQMGSDSCRQGFEPRAREKTHAEN
jgi:hypothetical protein